MIRILLGFSAIIISAGASDMDAQLIDCIIPAVIGIMLFLSGAYSLIMDETND